MDFYSNSQPNLVSARIRNKVKLLTTPPKKSIQINSSLDKAICTIYTSYIKPNRLILIFLLTIGIFGWYRYKQKMNESAIANEIDQFIDEDMVQNNIEKQTIHLDNTPETTNQPSMNPLFPVSTQYNEKVNYPPGPLPINIDNNITYKQNLYNSQPFPNLINPNINYNAQNNYKTLSYYNGLHNPYKLPQDTSIINPLGYGNDFNSSTGNFIGQNVQANQKNIMDYGEIISQTNNTLNNLGPMNIDINSPELNIDPPYTSNINT